MWRALRFTSILAVASIMLGAGLFTTAAEATVAHTWYVAPSGSGGGSCSTPDFNSIQSAVTGATAGDTVDVCAGSYTEQVSVGKNLTLTGAGASSVTIQAPASMVDDGYDTVAPGSPPGYNVVEINTSTTVTMSGFTVSGPGFTGCDGITSGVAVRQGAAATLSNLDIVNITDNPISGCQNGEGIRIGTPRYGTVNEVGTATVTNVAVSNYQKNGIVVSGPGSALTLSNATVTGNGPVGPGSAAQNGIEVTYGATASLSYSTVTANVYTDPALAVSCGLLYLQAGGVKTKAMHVSGNQQDVCNSGKGGGHFNG